VSVAPISLPRSGGSRRTGGATFTTWRFAGRLARREVRRRPWRTLLVAMLVVVPVAAMAAGSVLYRTAQGTWAEDFARRAGQADVVVESVLGDEVDLSAVPAVRSSSHVEAWTGIEPVAAVGATDPYVWFTDLRMDDPLAAGIVEVRDGRAPVNPGEVLLDGGTAERLGVEIGETFELAQPRGSWTLVGTGRLADHHDVGVLVAPGFDRARLRDASASVRTLIELPDGSGPADGASAVYALERAGLFAQDRWNVPASAGEETAVQALAWGWVLQFLALVVVGVVIAAAFATSARRQLVTIGQLSSNGASPELVRRTLALQGAWSGGIGVLVGLALCAPAVVVVRPLAERVVNRTLGGYRVSIADIVLIAATALVVATVAAWAPARAAARVPVLSALAGRRPLPSAPRRLVPAGVALFAAGLAVLFVAASGAREATADSDLFGLVAVVGALGVVGGMCCATPLLVDAAGRAGAASRSATLRLAARSLARVRTRSAAVVTAVAATAGFAFSGATVAGVLVDEESTSMRIPADVVYVERGVAPSTVDAGADPGPLEPFQLDADRRARIDAVLDGPAAVPVRAATIDPAPVAPAGAATDDVAGTETWDGSFVATVADPAVIDLIGLSERDRRTLAATDVLELVRDDAPDGAEREVRLRDERGDVTIRVATARDATREPFLVLITPERAEALGLDVVDLGVLLDAPRDVTAEQANAVASILFGGSAATVFADASPADLGAGAGLGAEEGFGLVTPDTGWELSRRLVDALAVLVALVLTLLVVAIGLSLSASEGRDERDVLVAVGAPPRTLARVAGGKALVLAATGLLLAVPTGFLPAWVVLGTVSDGEVRFPWLAVTATLVIVPAAAALAAWASSALARRLRPVQMSGATAD